jgi:hypothetical protein
MVCNDLALLRFQTLCHKNAEKMYFILSRNLLQFMLLLLLLLLMILMLLLLLLFMSLLLLLLLLLMFFFDEHSRAHPFSNNLSRETEAINWNLRFCYLRKNVFFFHFVICEKNDFFISFCFVLIFAKQNVVCDKIQGSETWRPRLPFLVRQKCLWELHLL